MRRIAHLARLFQKAERKIYGVYFIEGDRRCAVTPREWPRIGHSARSQTATSSFVRRNRECLVKAKRHAKYKARTGVSAANGWPVSSHEIGCLKLIRIVASKLGEQSICLLQVEAVEAFGELAEDRSEKLFGVN